MLWRIIAFEFASILHFATVHTYQAAVILRWQINGLKIKGYCQFSIDLHLVSKKDSLVTMSITDCRFYTSMFHTQI